MGFFHSERFSVLTGQGPCPAEPLQGWQAPGSRPPHSQYRLPGHWLPFQPPTSRRAYWGQRRESAPLEGSGCMCTAKGKERTRGTYHLTTLHNPLHVSGAEIATEKPCDGQKATSGLKACWSTATFPPYPITHPSLQNRHMDFLTFMNGLFISTTEVMSSPLFVGCSSGEDYKIVLPCWVTISGLVARIMKIFSSLTPGCFIYLFILL